MPTEILDEILWLEGVAGSTRAGARSQASDLATGIEALVAAYDDETLTDAQIAAARTLSGDREPPNKKAIGLAAQIHAGLLPVSAIYPEVAKTSREFGSGIYESWALGAILSVLERAPEDEKITNYARALLSAQALCLAPGIRKIASTGVGPEGVRRTVLSRDSDRMGQGVDLSGLCARRMWWKTWSEHFYRDVSVLGIFTEMALNPRFIFRGKIHNVIKWAYGIGHRHVPTITVSGCVENMNRLPLGSGGVLHIIGTDEGIAAGMESCPKQTRGPTPFAWYRSGSDTLELVSASSQTGNAGAWHSVRSKLNGNAWRQESFVGDVIETEIPGEIEYHVRWTASGCRVEGPDIQPPVEPLPDPVPETTRGLIEFDAAGKKVAAQGYEDRYSVLKTAGEVMRRITEGTTSSALEGAEILVEKMRGKGW